MNHPHFWMHLKLLNFSHNRIQSWWSQEAYYKISDTLLSSQSNTELYISILSLHTRSQNTDYPGGFSIKYLPLEQQLVK